MTIVLSHNSYYMCRPIQADIMLQCGSTMTLCHNCLSFDHESDLKLVYNNVMIMDFMVNSA